jgi:hypothetical protein
MNSLYKQFERESNLDVYALGLDKGKWESRLEKFAELIVKECAGLFPNVYVEIETDYGHTPVIASDYIKKHFGVEE